VPAELRPPAWRLGSYSITVKGLPAAQAFPLTAETISDRSDPGRDPADRRYSALGCRDDVIGNAQGFRQKRIIISRLHIPIAAMVLWTLLVADDRVVDLTPCWAVATRS
jgi:hypothetical protein